MLSRPAVRVLAQSRTVADNGDVSVGNRHCELHIGSVAQIQVQLVQAEVRLSPVVVDGIGHVGIEQEVLAGFGQREAFQRRGGGFVPALQRRLEILQARDFRLERIAVAGVLRKVGLQAELQPVSLADPGVRPAKRGRQVQTRIACVFSTDSGCLL